MATRLGPSVFSERNLIAAFDSELFPQGWGVTQLVPNSEFVEGGARPYDHCCYSSGYYLGPDTASIMTGNTLRFTGGDLSNYYVTNPEYRGWNAGSLGSTGGNWMHYIVLPEALDPAQDFIVETSARFVYVSRTGNGSTDPLFQIGRHYYQQYGINYSQLGTTFKKLKFAFNGASVPESANAYLTFGCTSADAMLELDYFRAYSINKEEGLKNLANSSSISTLNISVNQLAELVFDGTDDYLSLGASDNWKIGQNGTIEVVVKREASVTTNHRLWCVFNNASHLDAYLDYSTGGLYMHGGVVGTNTQIPLNQYLHIVVRYKSGNISIWYNGVSQPLTGTISNYNIDGTSYSELFIGSYIDSSGYRWSGHYPIFRLYNIALSDSEIQKSYNEVKSRFNI